MTENTAQYILDQIHKGPTAFHVTANVCWLLEEAGFSRLREEETWTLVPGGRYYTVRNDSSVISFLMPSARPESFRMSASHSDSPCFKLKEHPEMETGAYIRLNTELYGGGILYSFLDRPLRIAGRLLAADPESGQIRPVLADTQTAAAVIPSLAIHFNRDVNNGYAFNLQKDTLPLLSMKSGEQQLSLQACLAAKAGIDPDQVLSSDLYLTSADEGCIWGPEGEFLSSPKLDDQECVYGTLLGFLAAVESVPADTVLLHAVFDNEEVGSSTRQGAASTFLRDVLQRICLKCDLDPEACQIALAKSFLISADNAQALHPDHTEKSDPINAPVLNGGIVLKFNASQKYATDGVSAAAVRKICRDQEIPCQDFANRSDIRGGSTLGTIADTVVPVRTADIGLAQLAMHSAYETAGTKDAEYLARFMQAYYEAADLGI